MDNLCLSELRIYPVKSLAGILVDQWPVDPRGLRYDRQWMVVDSAGRFLTQRTLPKMALIGTRILETDLELISAKGEHIRVPLDQNDGDELTVTVWGDRVRARAVNVFADQWLSDSLGRTCRLVYQPPASRRPVDPAYATPQDEVRFSDGFPFLLISEGSLAELNRQMGLQLEMSRFRPNLVVSGCDGYAEDTWRRISIGNIDFRLPKPCSRCTITTLDPQTGKKGKEPLETLKRTRRWKNQLYFGQNALHDNTGTLRIGDAVAVSLNGPAQPPLSQ
ncbi:MAG: MOSC N-terminal beta barrel domain-containing protein [Pseudomonadota bacterium]